MTKECFGSRVAWVPWRRPGFQLGLDIARIKAEHPEIADYLDYRSWAYKQEDAGATQQTIQDMLAVGDTEFSRAYQRQRVGGR